MQTQDELKQLFAELDQSTDRALAGLAKVRKNRAPVELRQSAMLLSTEIGLVLSLFALIKVWLERGFVH